MEPRVEQSEMPGPSASVRDRILAGAVRVIREQGTVGATTKAIARAAGVSEGSLYNHFANKSELIAAAMAQVTGGIREAVVRLFGEVGRGVLEDGLTEFAVAAIGFFTELLPITGQVIGDRDLIRRLREQAGAGYPAPGPGTGPVTGVAALSRYFEAEQKAGRIAADSSAPYLAAVLLGACQQHAFLTLMSGPSAVDAVAGLASDAREYARQVVRTLLRPHALA